MTTLKERLGFYSYFVGQNIIYVFQMLFLSIYFTNSLGIPAGVVGLILLGARIWDAVNDPMLSILVEKSNLKGGKFLPWIKAVVFLMPIVTILVFSFTTTIADASLTVKVIYASVTYVAWGMIYTISDAPAFALSTVMTNDPEERTGIISFARFAAMIGMIILLVLNGVLVNLELSYFVQAVIISVVALVFLLGINTTKEHVTSRVESPTLKQILGAIFGNKYLIAYVATAIAFSSTNFGLVLGPYLATDIFNNEFVTTIIMMAMMFPILVVAPFMPALIKKFGKNLLYNVTFISVIVFGVIMYFVGYENGILFYILSLIKGIWSTNISNR